MDKSSTLHNNADFETPSPRWYYYQDRTLRVEGPETIESLNCLLLNGLIAFNTPVLPESAIRQWQPCLTVFTGQEE